MPETLQQPSGQSPVLDGQVAPSMPEDMPPEQKREIYNTFAHIEAGTQNLAHDIDRLQLGGSRHQAEIDLLEGENGGSLTPNTSQYYQGILDASRVSPDEGYEKVWGPITDGRIVAGLSNLAHVYRSTNSHGFLSEYALPVSGRVGANNGSTKEAASPIDTVRKPIALGQEDMDQLLGAPEDERVAVLSEMLDPYRFRHDKDAPQQEITAQQGEKQQIVSLLESMDPSQGRDLLAVEAWKYFRHAAIGEGELARRSAGLISVPEFEQAITTVDARLPEHEPSTIVERFRHTSRKALEKTEDELGLNDKTKAKIGSEAAAASEDMAVTINMQLPQLARALFDSRRLLSLSETKKSGGNDVTSDAGRRELESDYGFYDEGEGDILPRPIYAAVALGEGERMHGPVGARGYGDCVITLKPEVTESRATYTYGDSGNMRYNRRNAITKDFDQASRVMTSAEMPEAKVVFENYDSDPDRKSSEEKGWPASKRYIEAQVLGGVEIDDIESITLPARTAYNTEPHLLERIKELYPSLNIKVLVKKEDAEDEAKRQIMEETSDRLGIEYIILNDDGTGEVADSRSENSVLSREQLDGILQNPDHTPNEILSFFDGKFKQDLDASSGTWEGYSIREHTAMVMGQYKKYLTGELPETVNPQVFELILALHDIGKPEAIKNGGHQHHYTVPLVKETMMDLGYDDEDIRFAEALIDGDPIGPVVRAGGGDLYENAEKIRQMAAKSGLELDDFWQALQVYYKADAGSYTVDAGGHRSLDDLFQFNPAEGKMSFAPKEQKWVIDALERQLLG